MSKHYTYGKQYSGELINKDISEVLISGETWNIKRDGQKYYLEYLSGNLEGRLKEIEITKGDVDDVIGEKSTIYDLLLRYKAY